MMGYDPMSVNPRSCLYSHYLEAKVFTGVYSTYETAVSCEIFEGDFVSTCRPGTLRRVARGFAGVPRSASRWSDG